MSACNICEAPISRSNTTGLCRTCARRNRGIIKPRETGDCGDCGKKLGARNQSGYCSPCQTRRQASDPEFQAKRLAGMKRKWVDPDYLAKMKKLAQRMGQKAALDEELQERRREWGRYAYANWLGKPEVVAKAKASPTRGDTVSRRRLSWCPEEMRDRYRFLVRAKRIKAADARKIVEAEFQEVRAARHPYFPSVIDFMRRNTAVFDHGADKVKRYRVGLVDLTAGELLQRAEFRGYSYPQYPQKTGFSEESGKATLAA